MTNMNPDYIALAQLQSESAVQHHADYVEAARRILTNEAFASYLQGYFGVWINGEFFDFDPATNSAIQSEVENIIRERMVS